MTNEPHADILGSFRRLTQRIDDSADLLDTALVLDGAFHPDADLESCRHEIAAMAQEYQKEALSVADPLVRFHELGRYLGERLDLRGDRSDFASPDHAFVHRVLATRRGLPITLSTIYIAVADRAGISLSGIALPGHFIVGALDLTPAVFLDPFRGGRVLSRNACDRIVREVTGREHESAERYLVPTPPRALLTRMLNNLQMIYWNRHEATEGLLAARMLCMLNPETADHVKVRAYFYDRLGEIGSALVDYDAYLRRSPAAPDAAQVRRRVAYLRDALRNPGGS